MPKESGKNKKELEKITSVCPRCGSGILDVSKAPEIIRCLVCKHIFEHETEESRRRKEKELPHRIRALPSLIKLFKKPVEIDEDIEDEDKFKKKEKKLQTIRTKEETTRLTVAGVSITLMIIFFVLAALGTRIIFSETSKEIELKNEEIVIEKFYVQFDWLAFVMLGLMFGFGPIGIYESSRYTRIVKIEERLADFLRDLAESSRSGQTLHEAIINSATGEYGELLPDIKRMAIQISWGVSATDTLTMFANRVNTPLVRRAVTLINEASSAGGDVSKVLEAAANDTKELQLLQRERKIQMSLYVAVIFVSFVVFLVVILIVYATFVPQMKVNAMNQEQQDRDSGASSVDAEAVGSTFSPVGVDFGEIKYIFVYAALVHAIGDGLVAGLMGSGRLMDGLKLSFAMIMIVFIIFIFIMPAAAVG